MSTAFFAFNSLLETFIRELRKGFPQHAALLQKAEDTLELAVRANFKTPCQVFGRYAQPYGPKVMAKDPSVLEDFDRSGALGLQLQPLWQAADEDSREVIWQYLHSIFFLGLGVNELDEEALGVVDSLVKTLEGDGANIL